MNELTAKVLDCIEKSFKISKTFEGGYGSKASMIIYLVSAMTLKSYNGIIKVMYFQDEIGFIRDSDATIVSDALENKQRIASGNALNKFLRS